MDEIEKDTRTAWFGSLDIRLAEAGEFAVKLKLDEHFISDIDHLRSVAKHNREMEQ